VPNVAANPAAFESRCELQGGFMKSLRSAWIAVPLLLHLSAGFAAVPSCKPPKDNEWKNWLAAQEKLGGHTSQCHVNIKEQGLVNRIIDANSNKSGVCLSNGAVASSWSSEQALIIALKEATKSWESIMNHAQGNIVYEGPTKASSAKVGVVVSTRSKTNGNQCKDGKLNGTYECKDSAKWKVVFKRTADDCYLLTAYPF